MRRKEPSCSGMTSSEKKSIIFWCGRNAVKRDHPSGSGERQKSALWGQKKRQSGLYQFRAGIWLFAWHWANDRAWRLFMRLWHLCGRCRRAYSSSIPDPAWERDWDQEGCFAIWLWRYIGSYRRKLFPGRIILDTEGQRISKSPGSYRIRGGQGLEW